jgi:16S rRNA processing protein RimM
LVIGRITKPHGVQGEVRVAVHTDLPERFMWLEQVYVSAEEDDDAPEAVTVEGVRFNGQIILLKLAGSDNRDSADTLRGQWLQIPVAEAIPLEDGEYYLYQLIGLSVETEQGESLGTVTDLIETGANLVFVVNGSSGELLLPDIDEVVVSIDVDAKRMIVRLLPGLR